jgi:hypothetical protein
MDSKSDPIFAAIQRHRELRARADAFYARPKEAETPEDDNMSYALCEECAQALWNIHDTKPTTVAGVGAFLAYLTEHISRRASSLTLTPECSILFASDALARLSGGSNA